MNKKEQGEIALSIVRHSLDYPGVKLALITEKQRRWTSQAIGVPEEKINEFSDILLFEVDQREPLPLPAWEEQLPRVA